MENFRRFDDVPPQFCFAEFAVCAEVMAEAAFAIGSDGDEGEGGSCVRRCHHAGSVYAVFRERLQDEISEQVFANFPHCADGYAQARERDGGVVCTAAGMGFHFVKQGEFALVGEPVELPAEHVNDKNSER